MTTAEQIQKIGADFGVTAEVVQMDDPWYIPSDAPTGSDLGEAPFETRREVGV